MSIFQKFLNYLQKHPLASMFIGIIGLVLTVLAWRFPRQQPIDITYSENEQQKILSGSVFDLAKKMASEENTLVKQKMLEENTGLRVKDKGYLHDVSKRKENYLYDKKMGDYIQVEIIQTTSTIQEGVLYVNNLPEAITCIFSMDWYSTFLNANFDNEIEFTGTITDINPRYDLSFGYPSSVILDNCSLIQ